MLLACDVSGPHTMAGFRLGLHLVMHRLHSRVTLLPHCDIERGGGFKMRDVMADKDLVAYCGLYCGACRSYLRGRCPGCHENVKAKWCKVRTCCREHAHVTCADCGEFADPSQCGKFNNVFSRAMSLLFNSNRRACVMKIRELGIEGFAAYMAERRRQSLPRRTI